MTNFRDLQFAVFSPDLGSSGEARARRGLVGSALTPASMSRTPVHGAGGSRRGIFISFLVVLLLTHFSASAAQPTAREPVRWWKGNLHTHSLWSDGDDFPESIADWYKTNGYHFLALSDHNVMQEGERWVTVTNAARKLALEKYRARFGEKAVEMRANADVPQVRLKTLKEFGSLLNERNRFVLIPSEELSAQARLLPIHINATNLRRPVKPQNGSNVTEVIQKNVDAILAQRRHSGQSMFPHINHPNFGWAITAEDLLPVRGVQFFEVYNGHPSVHNEGDAHHASVERIWDILLAFRLSQLNLAPLHGLAVDDSHNYHKQSRSNSNPGRGWVMVRAPRLQAEAIVAAMEAGDFYASTGVTLKHIQRNERELTFEIEPEPGVTYTTEFIGTLVGFNPTSQTGPRPPKSIYPVTRHYSEEVGTVLAVAEGLRPSYTLEGDELYVRAKVISSKAKANPYAEGEKECAWVQPVVPGKNVSR